MNLPNKITIARILLTFIFMFFLFSRGLAFKMLALVTFLVASASDFLDGYLARKHNMITDFGRLMDPVADKVLVLAAFLAFVELKLVPAWMVVLIISRELIITGVRIMASTKGSVLAASLAGKHKTVSQIAAIFAILCYLILKEIGVLIPEYWIILLMLITVVLTMTSGVFYLIRNKNIFLNAKRN